MRHSADGFDGPFQEPYSPTSGMRTIIAGCRLVLLAPLGVMRSESSMRAEMSPSAAAPSPAAARRAPWAMIDARRAFSFAAMSPAFAQLESAFDGGSVRKSSGSSYAPGRSLEVNVGNLLASPCPHDHASSVVPVALRSWGRMSAAV